MSAIRNILDRHGASLSCLLLAVAILFGAVLDGQPALAIYLVSFLYYAVYWRAFAWGVRSFDSFKRDAVLLKTLSVAALAWLYLQSPLSPLSLLVIALGILLNVRAASVLGIDRTYYGQEVAGLPPVRVTAFPYSLLAHPMIVGNVLAFGGTLLNPGFRSAWWPLAILHVALNLALLAMELVGTRHRRALRIAGFVVLGGVGLAGVLFGLGPDRDLNAPLTLLAALVAAAAATVTALALHARPEASHSYAAGNDNHLEQGPS